MSAHDYWMALPDASGPAGSAGDEFPEPLPLPGDASLQFRRRDFLKAVGFAVGGAMLAGCARGVERKAIPYLVPAEEIIPGRTYRYATLCAACPAACGILTRNRDGRPIKLEGNPEHPTSRGRLCAVGQASILELYDSQRLKGPLAAGKPTTWAEVDARVRRALDEARARKQSVRFLTGTLTSPTVLASTDAFLRACAEGRRVAYDTLSAAALLDAYAETHGVRILPRLHLGRADVIASFDADFLGTWISPVEFTAGWRDGRTLTEKAPRFSHHVQFEARLSLTGAKADRRLAVLPGDLALVLAHLAARVADRAARPAPWGALDPCPVPTREVEDLAGRLWDARGRSLVVCGANDLTAQRLANYVNHLLDNYGEGDAQKPIDLAHPSLAREGNDRETAALLGELQAGKVGALFVHGVNPVYDLPEGPAWAAALKQVPLVVSTAEREDETAACATFVCPDHHFLESWGDAEAVAGIVTVSQPALRPLGGTRALVESLAAWSGAPRTALSILQDHWREQLFPLRVPGPAGTPGDSSFQAFWDTAVEVGFARVRREPVRPRAFRAEGLATAPRGDRPRADRMILARNQPPTRGPGPVGPLALVLYPKVGMPDGRHAHNPWLQELPDPISKVTWGNYAALAPDTADRLGVTDGDLVRVAVPRGAGAPPVTVELPVLRQPGQHPETVGIALGYGRKGTDRFALVGPQWLEAQPTVAAGCLVGVNAAALLGRRDGRLLYADLDVEVTRTGGRLPLAATQRHHSLTPPKALAAGGHAEPRPMVQETTLAAWRKDPASGRHAEHEGKSLWSEDHPATGRRWGMAVDLTACTGCAGCVVSCQAENNIPVVGKDEVFRAREMHWLRIDRYYRGEGEDVDVVHQPMLCHHCANAPCETVCPVLATVHGEEGLNQQVYNRCVGTRYCANNCPYKVRRFNWFDYPHQDRLQNMVLNPDVTVRSRGVMEKCTFCVQRIQEAKAEARREGRPLKDGDVAPACAQSCPAQAIVFGDLNDPESAVARRARDPRHFHVLEELNVRPSVGYLTLVRHRAAETEEKDHG